MGSETPNAPLMVRQQPGGQFAIINEEITTGNHFFVHNSGSDTAGRGRNPDSPCATIDYAIGLCTAGQGDRIHVMPGHAESLSSAGAIAADVAGVTIIGMGNKNNRPTITLHTTDATIAVSAANVTFRNLRIATDVDAVVKVFNITAAGCTIDRVDFIETSACACLQFVLTTSAAVDLTIQNCRWIQTGTAATAQMQWIKLVAAHRAKIDNNFANLKGYATSNPANSVVAATTATSDVEITNNRFVITNSTGNVPITLTTSSTGFVSGNAVGSSKTAIAGSIALASAYGANNYASNDVNTAGILDPVVDS